MLQSLHSLQQENRRLQLQIFGLTVKRERLQLLNIDLAGTFPPPPPLAAYGATHCSAQAHFLASAHEPLSTNKSPPSKSCFLNDASFVTSPEEPHSGSPSRSSSSLSFQSTPPQQSPASFGQPLPNGPGLTSFQLNANGVAGGANGVIQNAGPQAALPALRPQPPPLGAQGFALPKTLSPYVQEEMHVESLRRCDPGLGVAPPGV
ncbi:Protein AF-17 [Liparis tanakae]|uniref:Protein AF-17 n=1 Tax=Liparis tanakae TaxID=230148 RepID=A0A4Z2EHH7_9TELE|nr:Protein AF-17 [Liparis tanakae]